ncbi:MAG: hypothetical protein NDI90_17135 [Nitrospira sp. BO4]|jgi:hypothetical protein|nr:hypothetical protein [Nitrospira sp. BO4]
MNLNHGFTHIAEELPGILKEASRRVDLRLRLEAELGRPVKDDEFRVQAEGAGCWL